MGTISHITIPPARHTLALVLIMVTMTMMITVTTTSMFLAPPLVQSALADHGQEVVLSEKDSSFATISSGEGGNQVKVVVNYDVRDSMTLNDLAKAVMKVYSPDGTLVKTSSSPTPFRITDDQGTTTLATTLTDTTIEGVTAKIVFTNPIKTETISNELPVSVGNIKGATLSEESQEKKIPQVPSRSQSDSSQDAPIKPLSDALGKESIFQQNQKVTSKESMPQATSTTENPFMSETETETETETTTAPTPDELPMTQQNQKIISKQSMPQTTTTTENPFMSETETETTTAHAPAPDITAQDQLRLQQTQTMGQTPEVCEDNLDNDLDGKIDSKDEQCIGFTTSTSSPSIDAQSSQAQPSAEKEIGGENNDKAMEPQSDEEISENSGEREDGDDDEDEGSDDDDDNEEEDE